MFIQSTLIICFIISNYYMTNIEAVREKPPITNPSNGRQKPPIIRPPSPKTQVPSPNQKNDESAMQIGTPVATHSENIKEATERTPSISKTARVDSTVTYAGEAVKKPTKTKTKDNFIKLKNYDDNESASEEEMVEIEVNDSDDNETYNNETEETEVMQRPKKTITRKIKSKFKEATNENSILGQLLSNQNFMKATKSGAGIFGTLFGVCMIFVLMKMMKSI